MEANRPSTGLTKQRGRPSAVKVVVVDDHKFMREMISARLARDARNYDIVAEAEDAASAIERCQALKPDLVILDINLPDESGISIVPRIRHISPRTRILLCTAYVSDEYASEAARCGAHGFVEKTNTWDDFIDAVERVTRGECYFAFRDAGADASSDNGSQGIHTLTAREKEILRLIADAGSSKEIAGKLGISVTTVEKHRTNLMNKLRVRNVAGLVSFVF